MPIKKKRVRLSVEEKIWILNHRKENPLISQNKIALDFLAKFKKTVDRTCVTKVLQKSDQILAFSKADPEIERKKTKNITTMTKVEVVPLTFVEICYTVLRMYTEHVFSKKSRLFFKRQI